MKEPGGNGPKSLLNTLLQEFLNNSLIEYSNPKEFQYSKRICDSLFLGEHCSGKKKASAKRSSEENDEGTVGPKAMVR